MFSSYPPTSWHNNLSNLNGAFTKRTDSRDTSAACLMRSIASSIPRWKKWAPAHCMAMASTNFRAMREVRSTRIVLRSLQRVNLGLGWYFQVYGGHKVAWLYHFVPFNRFSVMLSTLLCGYGYVFVASPRFLCWCCRRPKKPRQDERDPIMSGDGVPRNLHGSARRFLQWSLSTR